MTSTATTVMARRCAGILLTRIHHSICDLLSHLRPNLPAGAVELRNEVARAVALELPGTLVFDYPTIDAIVDYIGSKVAAMSPGVAAAKQEQIAQVSRWAVAVQHRQPAVVPQLTKKALFCTIQLACSPLLQVVFNKMSSACMVVFSSPVLFGYRICSAAQCIVCCFVRQYISGMHTADRPVIALEAVRGRLPSAVSAASSIQLQSALQHAAYTADTVQPVPLDRWDANWLLLEAGSRWGVPYFRTMVHSELLGCSCCCRTCHTHAVKPHPLCFHTAVGQSASPDTLGHLWRAGRTSTPRPSTPRPRRPGSWTPSSGSCWRCIRHLALELHRNGSDLLALCGTCQAYASAGL